MQAFPSRSSPLKRAVQAALLGACLSGGALPLAVMAETLANDTQARDWQVAPGALANVLDQFARQAGISLSYDATSVANKSSPGLNGHFDRAQALGELLRGQGLQAQRQGASTWLLLPYMADSGALNLGATTVTGERLGATTDGTGSYTTGAVTIGKGQHSLRETPQSVSVMTRQLLDDQNLTTIEDVMEHTPGITAYASPMGGKYFYSRGFKMLG